MKKITIHLFCLLSILFVPAAVGADWTEKRLGKIAVIADKSARQEKWSRAIKYGEQMLRGSGALDQKTDARYIHFLKNLNRYYDKAGRLKEVRARVKEGYVLSKTHLGLRHETTMLSRMIYYKSLILDENYDLAIELVLEKISLSKEEDRDPYKKFHYLRQLYSLYRMTEQYGEEEITLRHILTLNRQKFAISDDEIHRTILDLAENYCRQNKDIDFKKLMKSYGLRYIC